MMNSRIIVGVSASHDASVVVLMDGEVRAGIQLERLTRTKHDGQPYLASDEAIAYCLDTLGLTVSDVDCFAFNIQPIVPGYFGLARPSHLSTFSSFDPFGSKSIFVSHHLAHAFCAYATSGHDRALVVVADGSGGTVVGADDLVLSGEEFAEYLTTPSQSLPPLHCISVYDFSPHGWKLLERETAPSFNVKCGSASLGETYAAVANYIFGSFHRSGKVMGLAPYGDANALPSFLDDGKPPKFTSSWKNSFRDPVDPYAWADKMDLAARVQRDLEEALTIRFATYRDRYHPRAVCYVGGLALNCSANRLIRQTLRPAALFLPSAPGDAGIAVGCAHAAQSKLKRRLSSVRVNNDFWGRSYSALEIDVAVASKASFLKTRQADSADIAHLLAQQKIVGVFQGGAEFGARALGHRSIIADARLHSTWQWINREVKYREDFRPFAPVCRREDAPEIFGSDLDHLFMNETVFVAPTWREKLGAVTHVDGTARLQTVTESSDSVFYEVITQLGAITGVPVILNTSLNVRGQPIAEFPSQAIDILCGTEIDAIYFADIGLLVERREREDINVACYGMRPGAGVSIRETKSGLICEMTSSGGRKLEAPPHVIPFLDAVVFRGMSVQDAAARYNMSDEGALFLEDLTDAGVLLRGTCDGQK
jgi:carbamoyltransferase